MENKFKESLLDKSIFSVTWELVPGRGATEKAQETVFKNAEAAAKSGKIHALTITDNPGGNPAISAEFLGAEIIKLGIEPLVHFTCKDKNRNQMEGLMHGLTRAGVRNLLVMTGDYPVSGFAGRPKPVFDLDPVHNLKLISDLNAGLEVGTAAKPAQLAKTEFFAGCAVSPFKRDEAEQVIQYYKLKKKIEAGAQFIVPQLGYDMRKFHEVFQFIRENGWDVPIMGNIYILPFGAGKAMNGNTVPGCVVTKELLAQLEKEKTAEDKGKGARLERAAKMFACFKGMGYDGVHIGGHGVPVGDVEFIIGRGEELAPNWPDLIKELEYPQPQGFYYYEKDAKTGLNTKAITKRAGRPLDTDVPMSYGFSRLMHVLMFEPGKNLFGLMRSMLKGIEGGKLEKPFYKFEHLNKVALFDCENCGDCGLFETAFVCPTSQCPKKQRNGACGGSFEGWCEVYPNKKKCIYVRAYARLKKHGEEESLRDVYVPPCNWDFYQTSSWINFFLGRDHVSKRLGIEAVPKK
ncbi:MAG: methylenetetrahydrofolate reductase C-terminal domain-containing protein [Syntrophales bacterium]